MIIPAAPKSILPIFTDKPISEMQDALISKLTWLNHAFGRCQRLIALKDGGNYFYPGIHIESGQYINVFPNSELGNFSFFHIIDPQKIEFNQRSYNKVSANYALIFWLNLDKIFISSTERNTEVVKAQILQTLTRELYLKSGSITVNNIYEQAENIYKGFSVKEIESQFLMQPYAGFRFEGEMIFNEGC